MPRKVNIDLDKVKELWETTSLSMVEIAKEVGGSFDTVRRRIISNEWIRPENLVKEEKDNRFKKIINTKVEKGIADTHNENELEQFKELYFNTDLSKHEIAERMGIKLSRVKSLIENLDTKRTDEHIKRVKQRINKNYAEINGGYNFSKQEIQDKVKQTKLKQYGNMNPFKTKRFKDQSKESKLERYDDIYYNNREQAVKTCIERYGVRNTMQYKKTVEKSVSARMSRINEISLKISKAKLEKFKNPENKQRMLDRVAKSCIEKYGVSNYMLSDDVKVTSQRISKTNRLYACKIDAEELEFTVEKYCYDIKKNDCLIEIDPTVSHNAEIPFVHIVGMCKEENCTKHSPVDKRYHLDKTLNAKKNGYHCIHVFDWDNFDKICYMLQDKETLYARNMHIEEVLSKDADEFLNKYHLQDTCKGQSVRLGLYRNDELIEIVTFGKPRYNRNYEWELLRLCTHKDYKVVGGVEKLFKHFIETYNPKSIISYCDVSKFRGDVYTKLGFTLSSTSSPSKHWSKGKMHITDNLLRQRGYDQLFDAHYGKGTDNELLMIQNGWLPVYDCGQLTFTWDKNN